MPGSYDYAPAIWLPLAGAAFAVVMALYCWPRRDAPAVWPLFYVFAFTFVCLLASAITAAAQEPAVKLDWFLVRQASLVPAATAGTCFVLEYTWPGRWLTRSTLVLLGLPALLAVLLTAVDDAGFMAPMLASSPSGQVQYEMGTGVFIFLAYVLLLTTINIIALLWLFARSSQHRWPAALMLLGQVSSRTLLLVDVVNQPWAPLFDPLVAGILISCVTYTVAVLAFRIFDPLPLARQAVFEQLPAGGVVFDARGRVLSLNPAAETILGTTASGARGKTWRELVPADEFLAERLGGGELLLRSRPPQVQSADLPDIVLGQGAGARPYTRLLSPLCDARGLLLGYLLVLPDMTDVRQAQSLALEHERMLAVQSERERMARELHDSLGQVLSYTSLQVETAAQLALAGRGEAAAGQLDRLGEVVREAHADLREQIINLASTSALEESLFAAARQYLDGFTRSCDIRTRLTVEPGLDDESLPPVVRLQLFRILQETLSNARKHGQAHQVQVSFTARDGRIRMTVDDDGCGFDPQRVAGTSGSHFGLQFMRDRAEELGGSLQVTSAPGRGTRVAVEIPRSRS